MLKFGPVKALNEMIIVQYKSVRFSVLKHGIMLLYYTMYIIILCARLSSVGRARRLVQANNHVCVQWHPGQWRVSLAGSTPIGKTKDGDP